jgi:hypothetical protein
MSPWPRLTIAAYLLCGTLAWAGPMEDFKAAAAAQERGDYATALRMFQALADQNIPGGLWAMGAMYAEGKGVARDYAAAARWYRRAADRGHPLSQYELGAFYDRGIGVTQSPTEAAKWFRRAADQGYGMAQVNLGAMYSTGEGVPQDIVEAYKWFSVAAAGGGYLDNGGVQAEAARRRDALASRISAAQRAEGQARASQWKAVPDPEGVVAATDLLKSQQQDNSTNQAAPAKGTPAEVAASFALSTCYEVLDDISRVKSYARIMKWQPLSADAKNVMRPIASGSDYEAWLVNENGIQFFVSAHVGSFRGKPAQVCQVFTPIAVEQLMASLASKVRLSQPQTAEIGMQRNEVYQLLQHPTGRPALLFVAKSKEGNKGAVLGFMGVQP